MGRLSRALALLSTFAMVVVAGMAIVPQVQAASYTVTITSTQYVPSTLQVSVGDTITFINSSSATASARTSVVTGFNTGDIGPGSSKQVTLNTAGTFTYSSPANPSLTGTVTAVAGSTSLLDTSGTATVSGQTGTVPKTQSLPVSGNTENVIMLLAAGAFFIGFGWWRWYRTGLPTITIELVDVPLLSSMQDQHEDKPQS